MRKPRLKAPRPALVISLVALFVALGGTTYAATSLPKNSVGTAQLKNGAVTKTKINKKTITALKGSRGPQGLQGQQGAAGQPGPPGPPGPVTTTLPSGDTLRGEFKIDTYAPSSSWTAGTFISFGGYTLSSAPTPEAVGLGGPPTADCPGTAASPTAAPGKLCFYLTVRVNVSTSAPYTLGPGMTSEDAPTGTDGKADPFGTQLYAQSPSTGRMEIDGTWAVTG